MRLFFWTLLLLWLPAAAQPALSDFSSLEQTAMSLGKPYFIFAFSESSQAADSMENAVLNQAYIHDFIAENYLGSYIGPAALADGYSTFRQLYRITQTSLLVFDRWGKIVARHTDLVHTSDLYQALYWDLQQMKLNPNPVAGAVLAPPAQRRVSVPVPRPLEAEAGFDLADVPDKPAARGRTRSDEPGTAPASHYVVINPVLPGLKAYRPELRASGETITVVMGVYPSQPRLVAALQNLRKQTTLPCYAFLATDEAGTPFYTLSVGFFSSAISAWEQVLSEIPATTPVCVGLLSAP